LAALTTESFQVLSDEHRLFAHSCGVVVLLPPPHPPAMSATTRTAIASPRRMSVMPAMIA
jgi:hypothetical protein